MEKRAKRLRSGNKLGEPRQSLGRKLLGAGLSNYDKNGENYSGGKNLLHLVQLIECEKSRVQINIFNRLKISLWIAELHGFH